MTDTEIMPILDNPALGIYFGKDTAVEDAKNLRIRIMLSPGEFSVSSKAHERFVRRILSYGKTHEIATIGGTEASESARNNTHDLLMHLAPDYGYSPVANRHGEWLLTNNDFGKVADSGFIPVIPAQGGTAASGAHDIRGILWTHVKPLNPLYGDCFFGSSHYLTKGEDPHTARGEANMKLRAAIDAWGKDKGVGSNLVWHMADTNTHMPRHQPYSDHWVNCWQDTHNYPGTNGGHSCIDTIARWKGDGRVKIRSARVLNDNLLPLPVDHSSVVASYDIKPVHNA